MNLDPTALSARSRSGDVDYSVHGIGYAVQRRPDPRIAARIHAALGDARTVLNVGAGTGSYEPEDRYVLAVEPSAVMRAQRPAGAAPAVNATAQQLPFDDRSFDAVMAVLTVHQWNDLPRGLAELRRVARGPVVVLTFDGDAFDRFWLTDYVPELVTHERNRFPSIGTLVEHLGGSTAVKSIPIPHDCTDGFNEAFYARPERILDPLVRRSQSGWSFLPEEVVARALGRLEADLASGRWDEQYGTLRTQPTFDGSLRLITSV